MEAMVSRYPTARLPALVAAEAPRVAMDSAARLPANGSQSRPTAFWYWIWRNQPWPMEL